MLISIQCFRFFNGIFGIFSRQLWQIWTAVQTGDKKCLQFRAALAAGGQIVKMSKYYLSQITGNMALTFRLRIKKELGRHKLSEKLAFNLFKWCKQIVLTDAKVPQILTIRKMTTTFLLQTTKILNYKISTEIMLIAKDCQILGSGQIYLCQDISFHCYQALRGDCQFDHEGSHIL